MLSANSCRLLKTSPPTAGADLSRQALPRRGRCLYNFAACAAFYEPEDFPRNF